MKKITFTLATVVILYNLGTAQINSDSTNTFNSSDSSVSINTNQLVVNDSSKRKPDVKTKKFNCNNNTNCLYNYKPKVDIPVTILGIAGSITGNLLIGSKSNSDTATILALNPQDVIGINRGTVNNYDPNAGPISDYFLYGGFFYGFLALADHDMRQDGAKICLLFLETMAITGTSYEMTAGLVNKYRPYAYNNDSVLQDGAYVPVVDIGRRTSYNAKNSFYGGHPSVPAASTFFLASVYAQYHPHSPFRFVLYGVAVAATSTTAYLRLKGGYHFPTDVAIGVALGTTYGLLIPRLHQCTKVPGLTMMPLLGRNKGMSFAYTF
ncbi:MAG: phosphatase PAP2 family protein [Chitinophagales bacterium]|nr:phosphatase PAP2 family protein [Chitinophagales bacterium]